MSDFDFSIDENVETVEEGLGAVLAPGVHTSVVLSKVEYVTPDEDDTSAKWEEALDFTFETTSTTLKRDAQGNVMTDANGNKIVISTSGQSIVKREFYSKSKTDEKKAKNMLSRIKHILTKFVLEDKAIVKGKDFKTLSKGVIKLLDESKEGKKVRLKVVKSGKYNQVPYYMPFIESMEVKSTKLSMSSKEYEGEAPSNLSDLDDDGDIDIPDID